MKLTWDEAAKRLYETGVDRVVLFHMDGTKGKADSGGTVSSDSVSDLFLSFVFLVVSSLFFEQPAREMIIARVRTLDTNRFIHTPPKISFIINQQIADVEFPPRKKELPSGNSFSFESISSISISE